MIIKESNGKKVYSDGTETELNMLEIANKYPEDASQDFIADDSRYTINNTFSAVRHNILNWYPFKANADVCEIGAGMGAVTGMLCERCKNVTAIEMNDLRADVIRARYPERKNLTVLSEDINYWKTEKKFDYVIFVGVLEYAAIFSKRNNPFEEFISSAAKLLKPEGILLFAIENRFGLKYWCGASEDHLQQPFVGLEGYRSPKTARTFSKAELEEMLINCNLSNHRFYYVLPDYKFPNLICTDEYMPGYYDLKKVPFTYGRNSKLLFDEKLVYKDILENKKLDFFANSYLIECSFRKLPPKHVVYVSARGECKKEYRIITTIDSEKCVVKRPAHEDAKKHIDRIYDNTMELKERGVDILEYQKVDGTLRNSIYEGMKADQYFENCLKENDFRVICNLVDYLREDLMKSSEISNSFDNFLEEIGFSSSSYDWGVILKNGFIDMTFYNSFYNDGRLVFFDQEWRFDNIPLNFVLYYAVKTVYNRVETNTAIQLENILDYIGVGEERVAYDELEKYIWSTVLYRQGDIYGEDGYCNLYNDASTLPHTLDRLVNAKEIVDSENKKLGEVKQNLEVVKQNLEVEKQNLEVEKQNLEIEKQNLINEMKNKGEQVELLTESQFDLQTTIRNKEGHINLLLDVEREYERIKQSRAWRLMGLIWKASDTLLPRGSKRRLAVKIMWKFLRKPGAFLKKLSPARIRKFYYYLRREGVTGVSRRFDECLIGSDVVSKEIEVNEIKPSVCKNIEDYVKILVPFFDKPKVSIIIPVYNQFEYTYNCIKAIVENSGDVHYEIIIANDCSEDLTVRFEEIIQGVQVVTNCENLRFLRNCNNAVQYAKGEYLLFLNNDTQVQKDWLVPLVNLIESDAAIGMVGSKLIYPDGRLQEAGGIVWNDASAWNYGHLSDPNEPEYNYVKEVDYISGASIMIRHSLWDEIGGFDERFVPAYYEDTDLAFEVRRHGYKVVYQPLSCVVHFEGISNGTDTSQGQKVYQIENQKKFFEKWREVLLKENFISSENVFVAKDRSRFKKQILVVDHYVPHYDQDAGGKCTYMYIKLFLKLGMKVTFIGDNFFPHQPYTQELEQMGVEVLYGNYYFNNWKKWIKINGSMFDYIYLNRAHIAVKYIDIVKKYSDAKVFYFNVDMQHIREYREYELTGDKILLERAKKAERLEMELSEKADILHVVGSYEKNILQKKFPDKPVRNIPVYIYENLKTSVPEPDDRENILFVGGFSHKPNVDGVMWFYAEVFPKILEAYPEIKWHIVGSNVTEEVSALQGDNIICHGFVSDEELIELYRTCRVCVAPLRFGAGVKGKIVEAVYNRIPLVTTPIGGEGLSLDEGAFLIADGSDEFSANVLKLYTESERCRKLQDNCIDFIRNHFTEDVAKNEILKDIEL